MPVSTTTLDRIGARDGALVRFAFRSLDGVCIQDLVVLSRLNGRPVRTPTDASNVSSRPRPHGSGPMWFAIPSS
jgi:hypothetical protein